MDLTDLDPDKIDMDLKWWLFKETLLNMANNVIKVNNDHLYYVIRPDQPAGWVPPNAFEQKMCQLPHTGAVYNRGNKIVWENILKAYLNTPARKWIK